MPARCRGVHFGNISRPHLVSIELPILNMKINKLWSYSESVLASSARLHFTRICMDCTENTEDCILRCLYVNGMLWVPAFTQQNKNHFPLTLTVLWIPAKILPGVNSIQVCDGKTWRQAFLLFLHYEHFTFNSYTCHQLCLHWNSLFLIHSRIFMFCFTENIVVKYLMGPLMTSL